MVRGKKSVMVAVGTLGLMTVLVTQSTLTTPKAQAAFFGRSSAPAWEMARVDGRTLSSDELKGNVIVVSFWATWCLPCLVEVPHLVELQDRYARHGLKIVGASIDDSGTAVVKAVSESLKMNYAVGIAPRKMVDDFGGLSSVPTMFIIDRDGKIARQYTGFVKKQVLERDVLALLAKAK